VIGLWQQDEVVGKLSMRSAEALSGSEYKGVTGPSYILNSIGCGMVCVGEVIRNVGMVSEKNKRWFGGA
jgi:hypothetical protein